MWIYALYVVIGWLVGVFINHAADVLPGGGSLQQEPTCTYCGNPRQPAAWSAISAYLSRRHVCLGCGSQVPIRHVIVEIATPLIFVFLMRVYGPSAELGFLSLYNVVLILVAVTDLEHRLILNSVTYPAILIALAGSFITGSPPLWSALVGGLIGFLFFYVAAMLRPGALGAGDVKLALFLGLIVGWPEVITMLLISILAGGIISALLVAFRSVTMKSAIPYGPFLVFGGWATLFAGSRLVDWYIAYLQYWMK